MVISYIYSDMLAHEISVLRAPTVSTPPVTTVIFIYIAPSSSPEQRAQ
jgi:hypothetical protein